MEIKAIEVTKTIRGSRVLDHITAEFHSGKITGLKGINGSGKTMLMRALSGLILPTSGTITYDGRVLGRDMTFPESLGALIENPAFLDTYSGFDNLTILASIKNKISAEEIKAWISRVGLDPEDRKKYKKYSLGMKQRLGIAAAVMERPDVVIFDEPTNALDDEGVEMFLQVVQEQKERGAVVIVSCHDYDLLQRVSDDIYFLENGRVVRYGVKENGFRAGEEAEHG